MTAKRTTMLAVMAGVVLAGTWAYRSTQAQYAPGDKPLKVAVVDVAKVLQDSEENRDREKVGQEKNQKIKSELQAMGAKAEAIKLELENALKPGSEEYSTRMMEFFEAQAKYESYKEAQKEILAAEAQAWTEALYAKFLEEVKRIAQQQDVTLVLGKDSSDIQTRSMSDLYTLIRTRKVLYNVASLDLTAEVLESLDRSYAAAKTE